MTMLRAQNIENHPTTPNKPSSTESGLSTSPFCEITFHAQDSEGKDYAHTVPFRPDANAIQRALQSEFPSHARASTKDGVVFQEIQQLVDSQPAAAITPAMHVEVLDKLREESPAYTLHTKITTEYADRIRWSLQKSKSTNDEKEPEKPSTLAILKKMQSHGYYASNVAFTEKQIQNLEIELKARDEKLKQKEAKKADGKQENEEQEESYSDIWFDSKTAPQPASYFQKTHVTTKDKHVHFQNVLASTHVKESLTKDHLLHVRDCEALKCSLNPANSPYIQSIHDAALNSIIEFMKDKKRDETIVIGGFASHLLRPELRIVESLIKLGFSKFQFVVLDTAFTELTQLFSDSYPTATMNGTLDTATQSKAIEEFLTRIRALTGNNIKMDVFANIAQLERFFRAPGAPRMNILFGQDFFTKFGCRESNSKYATPKAHEDFMRMMNAGLANNGGCFEIIKDDNTQKIFLNTMNFTEEYQTDKKGEPMRYRANRYSFGAMMGASQIEEEEPERGLGPGGRPAECRQM